MGDAHVSAGFSLPAMPAGLTPAWFTEVLRATGRLRGSVTSLHLEDIGAGAGLMSGVARASLEYAQDETSAPSSLIVKYPIDNAANREVAMQYGVYEREVRFVSDLAPQCAVNTPEVIAAAIEGSNFVILLEDLGDYRVGDQASGADREETECAVLEIAKLHAPFWNRVDGLSWVPSVAASNHAEMMQALGGPGWAQMVQLFGEVMPPALRDFGPHFAGAVADLQQRMASGPQTLVHGDFRMENLMFGVRPEHRRVVLLDWQGPLKARSTWDVALFLGQSARIDVRRECERELLERYVDALRAMDVRDYSTAQAFDDYRLALLHNWSYTCVVAGSLDAGNEHGMAWLREMVRRQSTVTEDLDLLDLMP